MNQPQRVPGKAERLWHQGEAYAMQRQWRPALAAYEAILEHHPGHIMALLRASRTALSLGRYLSAREYALRALAQRPESDEALITLARSLRMFNEPLALLECVEHSGWRGRRSAAWLTELAMLVSTIGENGLAMELLDAALKLDPRHPPTRYFRGVVHMFFGDMAASEAELEACIALAPDFAQAHWVLSRLRKQTSADNHIERLGRQLQRAVPGKDGEAYLAFAAHNELHDVARHGEAWEALERGCRVKRRLTPHDRADAAAMFGNLHALCDADFVRPVEQVRAPFVPVFIVGMHRSGSTLLEQLLGGHPDVQDGGETYSFTTQLRYAADYRNAGVLDAEMTRRAADLDYGLVGRRFHEATAWRARGKPFLTEKLPSNFLNLGFIAKALPGARILHMVRDPVDTCFSNLRIMFSDVNAYTYDQAELAEWYAQYRRLLDHWHAVMPDRILDVRYDALVADPDGVMRDVLAFCGLAWHASAATLERPGAVATASSPQMRQGIVKNRGAAWEPYRDQLAPLLQGLSAYR